MTLFRNRGEAGQRLARRLTKLEAAHIVVAVPTAALSVANEFRRNVDKFVAIMTPADFVRVGQWYQDFSQTTDEEVCELLERLN